MTSVISLNHRKQCELPNPWRDNNTVHTVHVHSFIKLKVEKILFSPPPLESWSLSHPSPPTSEGSVSCLIHEEKTTLYIHYHSWFLLLLLTGTSASPAPSTATGASPATTPTAAPSWGPPSVARAWGATCLRQDSRNLAAAPSTTATAPSWLRGSGRSPTWRRRCARTTGRAARASGESTATSPTGSPSWPSTSVRNCER